MQISTSFLVGCAALLCILPQSIRAADTEAQAKAREALRQKLNDLQPQPSGVPSPPPEAPQPAAAPSDKLRDALREKMNEQQAQPSAVAPAQPSAVAPSPSVTPAPRVTEIPKPTRPKRAAKPAPTPVPEPARVTEAPATPEPAPTPEVVAPPPVDSEAAAKQREAVRKKMDELQGQPSETIAVRPPGQAAPSAAPVARKTVKPAPHFQEVPSQPSSTPVQNPAPVPQPTFTTSDTETGFHVVTSKEKKSKKRMGPTFPTLQGPELTISGEKQQRLQELLHRYQADEITPAQYHEERAKILAGP